MQHAPCRRGGGAAGRKRSPARRLLDVCGYREIAGGVPGGL